MQKYQIKAEKNYFQNRTIREKEIGKGSDLAEIDSVQNLFNADSSQFQNRKQTDYNPSSFEGKKSVQETNLQSVLAHRK